MMKTFEVELRAFQDGVIRNVQVGEQFLTGDALNDLEQIFHFGQNDIQPIAGRCSVSVGDVVRYNGQLWWCAVCGWTLLEKWTVEILACSGNVKKIWEGGATSGQDAIEQAKAWALTLPIGSDFKIVAWYVKA